LLPVAEAGDQRLGLGQVDLILVVDGDRDVVERGVTLGAFRRQRDLDGAVDLSRRRCGAMAGRMPRLAPRPLGVGLRRPLGVYLISGSDEMCSSPWKTRTLEFQGKLRQPSFNRSIESRPEWVEIPMKHR
jgi:hypothetical protein